MPIPSHLREHILQRDAYAIWGASGSHLSFKSFWAKRKLVCLAVLHDPTALVRCSGAQTLEHVKDELRMGKKAPDDEFHLVASCWYHNSFSPPSKSLRTFYRAYLANARRKKAEQTSRRHQPEVAQDRDDRD